MVDKTLLFYIIPEMLISNFKAMNTKCIILIFFLSVLYTSCIQVQQPSDKKSSIEPDTTGFYAARNLDGLGEFQIGKSTYMNTINSLKNEWRKDKRYSYSNNGKESGELFKGLKELKNDTATISKNTSSFSTRFLACKDVKAIGLDHYFIGDNEIDSLLLIFYEDILIRIDCQQNNKIDEGFTLKYGAGKVKDKTIWITPVGRTEKRPGDNLIINGSAHIFSIYNEKIWENQMVKATSYVYISYKYKDKKYLGEDYLILDFSIGSKDEIKNNEMMKCDSIYRASSKESKELRNK
jgi:hypothetical protein